MRKEQAPKQLPADPEREWHGVKFIHPAFGQISVSRVTSTPGAVLYGSEFRHQHFMVLQISGSELHRNLASDWHHPTEEIIEVAFSEAQWATFQSSPNQGGGIPCTILHVERKPRPSIPYRKQEAVFRDEARRRMNDTQQRVEQTIKKMESTIGKSLSGVKRDELLAELRLLERDLSDALPFIMDRMEQHMEEVVEQAKVEVNSYIQRVTHEAGLAALTGKIPLRLNSTEVTTPEKETDKSTS